MQCLTLLAFGVLCAVAAGRTRYLLQCYSVHGFNRYYGEASFTTYKPSNYHCCSITNSIAYKVVTVYENGSRKEDPLTNCTLDQREAHLIVCLLDQADFIVLQGSFFPYLDAVKQETA